MTPRDTEPWGPGAGEAPWGSEDGPPDGSQATTGASDEGRRGADPDPPGQDVPAGPEPSDAELVQALAQGDPEPLGELFLRHGAMVLGVLRRHAGGLPASELEDLRQETFLTALEVAPRFRNTGTVRSWLCGIALQLGRNRGRRLGTRLRLLRRFGSSSTGVAKGADDPVAGAVLSRVDTQRALGKLPHSQREVLLLHVVGGLGAGEIADALGIAENTVWTRLHRARRALREALEEPTAETLAAPRALADAGEGGEP